MASSQRTHPQHPHVLRKCSRTVLMVSHCWLNTEWNYIQLPTVPPPTHVTSIPCRVLLVAAPSQQLPLEYTLSPEGMIRKIQLSCLYPHYHYLWVTCLVKNLLPEDNIPQLLFPLRSPLNLLLNINSNILCISQLSGQWKLNKLMLKE